MSRLSKQKLPARKIIPLAAFGVLMAGSVPVNWSFLKAEAGKLGLIDTSATRLAKGKVTEELTAKYNESSPFRDFGIEAFGTLSYLAFNEARSGAQIGANGVLFSNEEFETGPASAARIDAAVAYIAKVDSALKARGIALIVAPLPLKAEIDHANLGALALPAELAGRYDAVRGKLISAGVASVDLSARFAAAHGDARVFLAADTHWTPHGAAVAAEAIAAAAEPLGLPGETGFSIASAEPKEHPGDLRKFVRLLPFVEQFGPQHDSIAVPRAEPRQSADAGLFDEAAIPVALVGTSYSANPDFGFEAHLKAALSRDVLNLAEEGKGPFAPMQAFLKSDVLKNTPPRLVIWEMPVRYLDDAFPAEQFTLPAVLP
jgi:alginate O-acetyltransferase complex protein AlgJ